MFRIRRIFDIVLPLNKLSLEQVRAIFMDHFDEAPREDIDELSTRLLNPFKKRFRTVLYVAENAGHRVLGFAILLHEPALKFCYLDYVATAKNIRGRGIGAALYEFVRDESLGMSAEGLFFECLPDDPENCSDTDKRKQNQARMRFYERYGARPIVGTGYETPLPGGTDSELPHLMYDGLDQTKALSPEYARPVVQAVLERKYSEICTPDYIRKVVRSFGTSMKLRDFRYIKSIPILPPAERHLSPIAMTVNDRHDIHHIRERGYVESPVRIKAILSQLEPSGLVETMAVKEYPLKHIKAVHDPEFVEYLRRACANAPENTSVYPYVFPIRNATRPPKELSVRAGYYCIDTFTPINRNAWPAARRAVDCTLAAADQILEGWPLAYALVRPPGHHAERRSFGGFCYFNNAAVAAHYLSQFGKVAMLDIDYHHGNGQQDIFYSRSDVLTVSIHGDPDFAYPYFTGFADERGEGEGEGFNLNIPLPVLQDGEQYRRALKRAIAVIKDFRPTFLVVPLGLDPAKGDPTGTWTLNPADFEENARLIAGLELPALIVQEGGYRTRTLGTNARHFFKGLTSGAVGFRVVH